MSTYPELLAASGVPTAPGLVGSGGLGSGLGPSLGSALAAGVFAPGINLHSKQAQVIMYR